MRVLIVSDGFGLIDSFEGYHDHSAKKECDSPLRKNMGFYVLRNGQWTTCILRNQPKHHTRKEAENENVAV